MPSTLVYVWAKLLIITPFHMPSLPPTVGGLEGIDKS